MIDPSKIKGNCKAAWNQFRTLLIYDADYKCENCKRTARTFHIHHIDECGLNNNPNNLMVLCSNCHANIHFLGIQLEPKFKAK